MEKKKDLVFEIRNWSLGKDLSKLGFAVFISIGRNVTFLKLRTSKESSLLLSTPQACRHMPDPFLNSTFCQCSYRLRLKLFLIFFFYHFSYYEFYRIDGISSVPCLFLLSSPSSVFSLLSLKFTLCGSPALPPPLILTTDAAFIFRNTHYINPNQNPARSSEPHYRISSLQLWSSHSGLLLQLCKITIPVTK